MNVIKRNGKEVKFELDKIKQAIKKANKETDELTDDQINDITNKSLSKCLKYKRAISVEEIQDIVEDCLIQAKACQTSKHYIKYRYQRELDRKQNTIDGQVLTTVNLENEEVKQENSNKNPTIISTQRDYIAGLVSKDITNRYLLPKDIVDAHNKGIIHFHDADYFVQKIHNCSLINLEDMLQNGTMMNGTKIEKPHSFLTACTVATQIMALVASHQYGGQTINLSHLAPFIDISRQRIRKEILNELVNSNINPTKDQINNISESRLKYEIKKGVQTIQYQILTISSTNGQTPFVSLFMYLGELEGQAKEDLALIIEEMLKQRIQGVKDKSGHWIAPTFPKLLYVLEEDNVHEDSKYYYLTKLAAECTSKRMVPDYISEKKMKEWKNGDVFGCMGCRSFLSYSEDHKYWGRFNKGVVTINLPDVACSSKKNVNKFWQIFDERLELCHKALLLRYERLKGTPSDVAPILWQDGALARLKPGETIDSLLINNYSTISLGYAGLWEMVYYMTGKKLTEPEGKAFGLEVMQHMHNKCDEWNKQLNLGFSMYGTPIESTTYKFAKCLQERFGIIEGVTDKSYITNSYHVHVTEKIDAFSKLSLESEFQMLSSGGAISYIELPHMGHNIEALLSIIKFMYDNICYSEMNMALDTCLCGFSGQLLLLEDEEGKLQWECPQCGTRDRSKLRPCRRTCGYLGSNFWNDGRTFEIMQRQPHVD